MRILLLEDTSTTRLIIQNSLIKLGHQVDAVENGQQGYMYATAHQYDLCICDILMPHWDGFKFIEAMSVVNANLPIVVASALEDQKSLREKLEKHENVTTVLPKPIDFNKLQEVLENTTTSNHQNSLKKARIVCTIGPSSKKYRTIANLVLAGMDIARLNFSHGSHDEHESVLNSIRKAEQEWMRPIAVIMDLCGPKIRTGQMQDDEILLIEGKNITIQSEVICGTAECISITSPEILKDLKKNDPILLDDGLLELIVEEIDSDKAICRVVIGGHLKSNKGINLPATNISLPTLTEKDLDDLKWGLNHSIDYVALSFVRSSKDILHLREIINKSGKRDLKIIAKIEKPEAVKDIDAIIEVSDAIMIARGDLGVEIPASRVPWIQRNIIKLCRSSNTPVITATQMLDSMTYNSRPTRAEVTDVSVAISEGTDAVMLSGETAAGTNPVNVVKTMASIICEAERHSELSPDHCKQLSEQTEINPALIAATSFSVSEATLVIDYENSLYQHLSKWNQHNITLLATNSLHAARHSCLYKNIFPIIIKDELSRDQIVFRVIDEAKKRGYLKNGDNLAVLEGCRMTQGGIDQIGAFQLVTI